MPVVFYMLGAFVSLIQAFVFTMLSIVYRVAGDWRSTSITSTRGTPMPHDVSVRQAWETARPRSGEEDREAWPERALKF